MQPTSVEEQAQRAVDKNKSWRRRNADIFKALELSTRHTIEDLAKFSSVLAVRVFRSQLSEMLGVARENATGKPQERFLAPLLPCQQRRSEGQQLSIALQIIPGKGGDGVSPQRRLCKITAEFLPGTTPNSRNRKPGCLGELTSQHFPPMGGRWDFQRGKELRLIGRRKSHLMDNI